METNKQELADSYIHHMMINCWDVPEQVSTVLESYVTRHCKHWNLVDRLVENNGFIRVDGVDYVPIMHNKTREGKQMIHSGQTGTGHYLLSFRSYKNWQLVLVQEKLVRPDGQQELTL